MQTKDLIIKDALALFCEKGYRNVSLREIARHVGVKHNTLLYYYGSKEGIAFEILLRYRDFILRESRLIYNTLASALQTPYYGMLIFNALSLKYITLDKTFGREYCICRMYAEDLFIEKYGPKDVESSLDSAFPGFAAAMFYTDEYTRIMSGNALRVISGFLIDDQITFTNAVYDMTVVYSHFAFKKEDINRDEVASFCKTYIDPHSADFSRLYHSLVFDTGSC